MSSILGFSNSFNKVSFSSFNSFILSVISCFLILIWFRWLELGKNLAFEKQVEQMLISACQKSSVTTVEMLKKA